MSSGACRALVALLLTLVATAGLALPVAAEVEALNESSEVTYTVNPRTGKIDVEILLVLRPANPNRPVPAGEWGPVVVEERARVPKARFTDLPGPWKAAYIPISRIEAGGQIKPIIKYTLDASLGQNPARMAETPARVSQGYVYVCIPGQDTDSGRTSLRLRTNANVNYRVDQSGSPLTEASRGLTSGEQLRPGDLFTCVEATRDGRLETTEFIGPADREIKLQAWPGENGWLFGAESIAERTLADIRVFLGHDMPGEGPVIIRQAPPREIGGYASAHDTKGVVQLDEAGGVIDPEHELAHAWFSTDNFIELWLREGLADWTATSMQGNVCAPVDANAADVELADWKVIQPNANIDTIEAEIAAQEAAACGVMSAMIERMGEEQWREVIGSMINGETKYIGSSGPGVAATTVVNYREWLDAVDERGLVPAAKADPAYAANLEDLDYAQDLLDEFGADVDPLELQARSAARAYYHQFLEDAAPLGAPLAVRKAMDDWSFRSATQAIDKSYEVLNALQEAIALLPDADIFPIIQPDFEAAANEAALDAVLTETLALLDSATGVVGPLGELQSATPEGWQLPAAVRDAIAERRFEDIMGSIAPALAVVQEVTAADEALPQAGLLDAYRARYEATTTANKLDELAADAANVRRAAEAAGRELSLLETEVGEWQIPSAVTEPLDNGQISNGLAIVTDARATVAAARAADIALPEAEISSGIRPEFEAVASGGEMAVLRADAEEKRDQAESIGGALNSLSARVPTWEVPELILEPIRERDFATAALVATAAQRWIDNAWEADQKLPDINAIEKTKARFEGATTLSELEEGGALAESWNIAANDVAQALAVSRQERDLLADLGLWGVDYQSNVDEALAAIEAGDVAEARNKSGAVIDQINSASSSGGLRLAGIVFLGVAILGVAGLWLMLRREAGPPWARQSTPHWVEKKGGRFGRGK